MFNWYLFVCLWCGIIIMITSAVVIVTDHFKRKRGEIGYINSEFAKVYCYIFIPFALFLAIYSSVSITKDSIGPSAVDVYRGKTALKIKETTVDGNIVKKDTVVVYKQN